MGKQKYNDIKLIKVGKKERKRVLDVKKTLKDYVSNWSCWIIVGVLLSFLFYSLPFTYYLSFDRKMKKNERKGRRERKREKELKI